MRKINKLFTEEVAGVKVVVSYDYKENTFKVVNEETDEVMKEGDETSVSAFLEVNGARIFAPRYMANYPVTKVNDNTANLQGLSPFGLLEFLRVRRDGTTLELMIYPREMQEGAKFLPGIKIPLGECLLESMDKSSMINLMVNFKESLPSLKKIAVRTYKECDNREVALVLDNGKYFPMVISPEDAGSFKNSIVLILQGNGVEIDKDALEKALMTPNTMSVVSQDLQEVEKDDTIKECFSVDDLINSQVVVFESSDLNALSHTLFHVHPEASSRKWKVSEIKECANKKGFYFEVQGKNTDDLLSDEMILGRLLSENVYITHNTPLHNSSPMDKAVFALMNGVSLTEAINSMVSSQTELLKKEKTLSECGLGCIGGLADVAVVTADVNASAAPASCGDNGGAMTSSDIHGIAGKILYPMQKNNKKKKEKDIVKVNDDLKNQILTEMGIADKYYQATTFQTHDVEILKEDDDVGDTSDFNLSAELGNNDTSSLLPSLGDSDSNLPALPDTQGADGENGEQPKEEQPEEEKKVALVVGNNPDNSSEVAIETDDGSLVYEPMDNLIVSSSMKQNPEDVA